MKKDFLEIKLSHERLEAFAKQYENVIEFYYPENEHETLLLECAKAMHHRLLILANKNQVNYTVKLNSIEAISLFQFWKEINIVHDPYSKLIIQQAIASIDQHHKSAKAIQHAKRN